MPKKQIDYAKIGRLVGSGSTHRDAMVAGGFAESSAKRGIDSMSAEGKLAYESARDAQAMKKLKKFAAIGSKFSPEEQEKLVRGALLSNVADGTDKAPQSLKMLGQDKRVNMFIPDAQTGVIIVNAVPIPPIDPPSRYLSCGCRDYCQCQRKALP